MGFDGPMGLFDGPRASDGRAAPGVGRPPVVRRAGPC